MVGRKINKIKIACLVALYIKIESQKPAFQFQNSASETRFLVPFALRFS